MLRRQKAVDRERVEDRLEVLSRAAQRLASAYERIYQSAELLDELDHLPHAAVNVLLRTLIGAVVITCEGIDIQWLLWFMATPGGQPCARACGS